MTDTDIADLLALGITSDEIWCAIAEPGPWTASAPGLDDPTAPQGDYLGD